MKPIVFITGISSPILSKLALALKDEFAFRGVSRNPDKIHLPEMDIHSGDLLEPTSYEHVLEGCSMVIHGAAITHAKQSVVYDEMNYRATKQLVDLANQKGVKRFVFISSNTAGETSGGYGVSKLKAENYIREQFDQWTIIRPSEIFGVEKGEGIEKLIQDALHKTTLLCPTGIPTPLYPIHLDDVVHAMTTAIRNELGQEIIRIHGPKGYSYREIIELVHRTTGRSGRIIPIGKTWMFILKKVLQIAPFQLSIVPDQVDRLYSVKEIAEPSPTSISLEEYVRKQVE